MTGAAMTFPATEPVASYAVTVVDGSVMVRVS
jgi:hypothetical protein